MMVLCNKNYFKKYYIKYYAGVTRRSINSSVQYATESLMMKVACPGGVRAPASQSARSITIFDKPQACCVFVRALL